jgi:hypothetical protein
MQSGILPQGGEQGSHSRFAYQLSFTNLYKNAVMLENFEKMLVQASNAKQTMDLPLINE